MPTYEYGCKNCGNQWEETQRMTDAPLEECPKCHQKSAQRLISQGNFILKGGGWYTTGGYGSPEKKTTESSGSASTSGSGSTGASGSSGSSSESKSEPKSETKSESTTPAAPSAPKGDSST